MAKKPAKRDKNGRRRLRVGDIVTIEYKYNPAYDGAKCRITRVYMHHIVRLVYSLERLDGDSMRHMPDWAPCFLKLDTFMTDVHKAIDGVAK